jgi:hypothetical protein
VPPPGGVSPTAPGTPGAWSPTEAYSFAWNAIMKNFGGVALPLAVAMFVGFLPIGIVAGMMQFMMRLALEYVDASFLGVFAAALYAVIGGLNLIVFSFIAGGVVEFALKVSRGQRPEFGEVFAGGKYFGSMFVGFIGFAVAMALGLALCVIPGYIVQFGLWPFAFIIVEERAGGIDALKKAWAMTNGHKMNIFIFWLISLVVVIAGELACFLPVLLVSYPMIILASAHMYLSLKGETPRFAQ